MENGEGYTRQNKNLYKEIRITSLMTYKIEEIGNNKIQNPVLIEGLPGIGNIGKIAVDFIVDNLKAKKIFTINSYNFPHAVFINENHLVELPTIDIYHKKVNGKDILLLSGDIQPIDERSCYEFCDAVLDLIQKYKGKEIITIGGIGLQQIPNNPQVYCTANSSKIIKKYKSKNLESNIYGVVGPIMGVTGLLVGLSKKRNINSIAFLAETFGHPKYLGIKGSREVLKILDNKLKLNLNLKKLDSEIGEIEKEIRLKESKIRKNSDKNIGANFQDYIG